MGFNPVPLRAEPIRPPRPELAVVLGRRAASGGGDANRAALAAHRSGGQRRGSALPAGSQAWVNLRPEASPGTSTASTTAA